MRSNSQQPSDGQPTDGQGGQRKASSAPYHQPPAQPAKNETPPQDADRHPFRDAVITFASASITITTPAISISGPVSQVSDAAPVDKDEVERNKISESFEKYEERQEKLISDNYEKADSLLLTTSSGILALSIAFIGALFGKHPLTHRWEIFSGWGSLGVTIAMILLSYFAARKSLLHSIELARAKRDEYLAGSADGKQDVPEDVRCHGRVQARWQKLTETLNGLAACFFMLGIAFIVAFAITNMR